MRKVAGTDVIKAPTVTSDEGPIYEDSSTHGDFCALPLALASISYSASL